MEFPATYLLARQADQRRMDSARLDTPPDQPADHRRSIRAVFRLVTDVSARLGHHRDGNRTPAQAICPATTPNTSRA